MLWFCDQYVYSGIREVFCTPGYFLVSCSTLQFWLHHHYCCYFSTSCALRITPHCHSEPKKLTADTSLTNKKNQIRRHQILQCNIFEHSHQQMSYFMSICFIPTSFPLFGAPVEDTFHCAHRTHGFWVQFQPHCAAGEDPSLSWWAQDSLLFLRLVRLVNTMGNCTCFSFWCPPETFARWILKI